MCSSVPIRGVYKLDSSIDTLTYAQRLEYDSSCQFEKNEIENLSELVADKMADEVRQADALSILAAHKEQYRSVQVNKDIGVHYDSGNLMVSDVNLLDNDALKYVALQHPASICNHSRWSFLARIQPKERHRFVPQGAYSRQHAVVDWRNLEGQSDKSSFLVVNG